VYTKLRELAVAGAAPVTDAEVGAFYSEHVNRFVMPELRDVRVVLTKTRERANAARAALERGQTWRHVARKYSIDQASRRNGGLLLEVAEGSREQAFDEALFRAPQGKLRGPVRVQFGYYVFKVLKVRPAAQQTLEEAAPAIRQELEAQHQQEADEMFNTNLRSTWRPRTTCRAGYVMDQCSNGPPPPDDDEYPGF
jgi:foldase protein PrsA